MNLPTFEYVARRNDSVFGLVLGVARATLRGTDLFIVMAYGKGEADKAKDKHFTRVLDTFHFVGADRMPKSTAPGPTAGSYRAGAVVCAAAAALLAVLFSVTLFISRVRRHGA